MIHSHVRVLFVCLLCIFQETVFLCRTTGSSDKRELIVHLACFPSYRPVIYLLALFRPVIYLK